MTFALDRCFELTTQQPHSKPHQSQSAMKTAAISTTALLSMGVLLEGTAAFAPEQRPSNPTVCVAAPVEDRRAFVGGVISAAFGAAAFSNTPAAWADDEEKVEDLAMPTADEQKALDVSLPYTYGATFAQC